MEYIDQVEKLYKYFTGKIREEGIRVEEGIFGADMKVDILNDGPVTLIINKFHNDKGPEGR